MARYAGDLEGLAGFEKLDIGELYYIGNRTFVERGLAYYRQFAVEELQWDPKEKQLTALVMGSRRQAYEVYLQVRSGRLEHECDCPAWDTYGGCKHAIAATAAMFLAVQGKSIGGIKMPDDYAQALREQLGYSDVGQALAAAEQAVAEPSTELHLREISSYGSLRFEIKGPIPHAFLKSVGITLPNSYGFRTGREFSLGEPERSLAQFIKKAKAQKISLIAKIDDEPQSLSWSTERLHLQIQYALNGDEIARRLVFNNDKGASVEPFALIPATPFVLLKTGAFCRVKVANPEVPVGSTGPIQQFYDPESFNEAATGLSYEAMRRDADGFAFLVGHEAVSPEVLAPEAVTLELDLFAMENAAGECEALEFDSYVRLGDLRIDLCNVLGNTVDGVLHAYGGNLLSAKRRVRALCDLLRRILASGATVETIEFTDYRKEFTELFSDDFRFGVLEVVQRILEHLGPSEATFTALAGDAEGARWLAYPLDLRKCAMLYLSLSDLTSLREFQQLGEGSIEMKRRGEISDALQRIMTVCANLGVQVQFNAKPIRSEPLSISVDTQTAGTDIDWFALHPSIRCGERTIRPDEWQQLIQGKLLFEDAEGRLVMPQLGDAQGLEVLADLLKSQKRGKSNDSQANGGELQVSRLEMLDWILLRRHGVQVRLPVEAEAVFDRLIQFSGVSDFKAPASLQAELRQYQNDGCAWIDFLYRHRFGACLADDMGLGKTVQTIAFLAHRFEQGLRAQGAAVLIVLPPSLVFNWLDEFARFAPTLNVVDCLRKSDWSTQLKDAQIVLSTYDRVRLDIKELKEHEFEIVVFDEAHNLKNVSAARTQAAVQLRRRFTLCLTGTPVENNASEFYSVMSAAVPGLFGTLKAFKDAFRTHPDRILGRSRPFILRRTKAKILKELPKKEEHELFLSMSTLQKEIYTRTVAEVRQEVAEAYEDRPEQQAGIVALAAILRLRQVCVSPELLGKSLPEPAPKFAYMADKLEELQAEGNAALVFSQFIGGLDQMEAVAQARGLQYLRMDGRTPVSERKEIVRAFQKENGPSFFFISLKTGGVGLNLTRANYVFHLDPWWNPAVENQASDRAHRLGQTRSVFIQRLIMQHSIEARMLELKARKAELFRRLVEEPGVKTAQSGLSREDFDYLLNG